MLKSCIYEGTIRHRRFLPVENAFRYRLFLVYLDLAELEQVFALHPLWSCERPNIAWFRRGDHFGDPHLPLERAVRDLVQKRTGRRPSGPIRMLCHMRYFGHCFNPASFYYCWDPADTRVETIIVEIHNTPWGEVHTYVLDQAWNEHPVAGWQRHRMSKEFHVSPFIDMDIRYDWRFRDPGSELKVHMIDYQKGAQLFDASLALRRTQITPGSLTRVLVRYPLMTVKVVAMIYWQALKLKHKGVPIFTHPKKRLAPVPRSLP
jgi:uncharacterized protein